MEMPDTSTTMPPLVTTIIFCALCDKPFTKEPQYKRHVAYCRKSQGRTRPRSCRACNLAKIKCNSCTPCHQCVRKGVRCVYDPQQPRQRRDGATTKGLEEEVSTTITNTLSLPTDATSIGSEATPSGLGTQGLALGVEHDDLLGRFDQVQAMGFGASPDLSLLQYSLGKDGSGGIGLDGMYSGNSFSTTTTPTMTMPADVDCFMSLLHTSNNNTTTTTTTANSITGDVDFQLDNYNYYSGKEVQLPTFSPGPLTMINQSLFPSVPSPSTTTILTSPPSDTVLSGHFTKNKVQTSIQQSYATMIIDMIHAYPRMMMRRETLPPFVHAYSPAADTEDGQKRLPEHLTNCMGIAQLFAVCNDDTRLFVWATVRAEMTRFRDRMSTFNQYDVFSALQASLLYLIIRAVDDTPQEAKDDYEMLLTYEAVCKRAMKLSSDFHRVQERSPNIRWKDWIFAESIRRVACVWFLLGRIFHIRTGSPCFVSDTFREILLPCTKTEWEAKTESQWRTEYKNATASTRSASSSTSMHTFGDLIDAHQRLPGGRVSERLDIWNAQIDHLGMALNLAVYIV